MRLYRYIPLFALLLLPAANLSAQERDSAATQFNALDHVLQAPAVAKRYENKKVGDRFFLEIGAGVNNLFLRSSKTKVDWGHIGYEGNISLGDWITPEHGVRVSLGGKILRRKGIKNHAKVYGLSADYMMNITAIGSRTYAAPHRFELIGTAGFDVLQSRTGGKTKWVPGVHVGLRGQANTSSYTYIYIEPRISAYGENLLHRNSTYGWRPAASITAGMGYRLNPEERIYGGDFSNTRQLLDNTFLSFSAGPAAIISSRHSVWKEQTGARAFVHVGKWISPEHGVRLGLSLMEYAYHDKYAKGHVKGGALSADYLLNLHNVFGGYNPDRRFYFNALAGLSLNYLQTGEGKKWKPGVGAGLQANLRVGDFTTLFLEPRVDVYPKSFAAHAYSCKHADVAASLLAGVILGQSADMHNTYERNKAFKQSAWYDHAFIEAGAGLSVLLRNYSLHHIGSTISPDLHIGVGKWFSPVSGVRLKAEAGHAEWKGGARSFLSMGADYMWNLTNATTGYLPDRRFELIALAGLNLASHRNDGHIYLGGNLGVKGVWHASPVVGFYLEPMLLGYDNAFLPGTTASSLKIDLLARLHAGLQFNLNAHDGKAAEAYDAEDQRTFYTASVGGTGLAIGAKHLRNVGGLVRAGFGRWYSPVSAWRVTIGTEAIRHKEGRRAHYSGRLTAGADYLFDITTATLGENEDRSVSVRALAGANLGLRYESLGSRFCPDLHLGMQFALRIGKGWEVFAEPGLAYLAYAKRHDKARHLLPSLQAGFNYSFVRSERLADQHAGKQFVELAGGIGAWSNTVAKAHPFGRKITWAVSAAYGRFVGEHSAVRLGYSRTFVHKRNERGKGSQLGSLHLDYMQSLLPDDSGKFHLRAAAGVSVNAMEYDGYTRWGAGVNLGVQAAYGLTERCELFAEPTITILTRSLVPHTKHPVEGEGKVFVGTRYTF